MPEREIEVPREVREFMPDGAEETILGQRNGAKRQYRYGNLHIREYDDRFLVHVDRVDPRRDPVGHLVYDAPEFLIGAACAVAGGTAAARLLGGRRRSRALSAPAVILSSLAAGYLGYAAAKRAKEGRREKEEEPRRRG